MEVVSATFAGEDATTCLVDEGGVDGFIVVLVLWGETFAEVAGDRTLSEDIFVGGWDDNLSLGVKVANFGWLLPVSLAASCLFELNEGYESFFEAAESFIAIGVRGDGVALAVDDDVLVVGGGGDGDAIVKIIPSWKLLTPLYWGSAAASALSVSSVTSGCSCTEVSVAFLLPELQDVASRVVSRSADAAPNAFKMFFLFMRLGVRV